MHSPTRIAVVVAGATLAIGMLSGCTELKVYRLANDSGDQSAKAPVQLSDEQRMELRAALEGEIQTVYPSDIGLARVFGQVANLGDKPYTNVEFEVLASSGSSDGDSQRTEPVASFVVPALAPGQIEAFEVQTTARMGDFRQLEVVVKSAQ